jgi:ComF family protein
MPLTGAGSFGPMRCGRCLQKPTHFDTTICPYRFAEPMDWLIRQLKFRARLPHIRVLGSLLQQHLIDVGAERPQLIIPVPLHHTRQRQRGFNQALEIARPLAKYFNTPIASALCERHQNTMPQSDLPAKKRAANVRNAFRLRKPCDVKHVAIVDDVMTTGATVNELAKVLKRNGIEKVQVWVVARVLNT